MTKPFVHLHVHSDFSKLDGCSTVAEYVTEAEARGDPALAFTEHGSIRGFHELHLRTRGLKVRPIYGVEFYVAEQMEKREITDEEKTEITKGLDEKAAKKALKDYERKLGMEGRFHLTAWAKDAEGLANLFKLTTLAWTNGFYYKPRIDWMTLADHSKGLMIGTACLAGPLHKLVAEAQPVRAWEVATFLKDVFGDDLVAEIMPHAMEAQRKANQTVIGIAQRLGVRLVATQDAHYLYKEDQEHHEVLLAIGTGAKMWSEDRFRFDRGDTFHFKTRDEMAAGLVGYHGLDADLVEEALDNTVIVAERLQAVVNLDKLRGLLPKPTVPPEFRDAFHYMRSLCLEGWGWRDIPQRAERLASKRGMAPGDMLKEYAARLKRELAMLHAKGFEAYFLMVREMYAWARGQKITCGPGRGSAAGSLTSFLLGITSADPLEHELLFERFISPGRIDFPDIDCDFEDQRRQEILDYLGERYGREQVCRISTFGKLTTKQVVKDVARVFDVPFHEANQCTANIAEDLDVARNFAEQPYCIEFAKLYPKVPHHAQRLEGFVKNLGIHAAGVVVSPVPVVEILPVETRDHKGARIRVAAVDMEGVQDLGLVKLDVLGLRTLTTLRLTVEAVQKNHGVEVNLEEIPLDDPDTLAGFTENDFHGVFQFDTQAMGAVAGQMRFTAFAEIAVANAVNRPGLTRTGLAQKYIDRMNNPKLAEDHIYHPIVTELLKETFGVLVYQEQVMRLMTDLAGFTAEDADKVRKVIGKSEGAEAMAKWRDKFVTGVQSTHPDIEPDVAHKLMDNLAEFGAYAFNKCISGDTVVVRAGANKNTVAELPVWKLYEAQESRTPWGKKIRAGKVRLLQMDPDGRVRPGRLKKVYFNGRKLVYRVRTAGGRSICATLNHRLLTRRGYVRVDQLSVNDELAVMMPPAPRRKKGFARRGLGKKYRGCGFPAKDQNPSWTDGRQGMLDRAQEVVLGRSRGVCEWCGKKQSKADRFEFAHVRPLEQCGGRFDLYHNENNLLRLCNGCHKRFDYAKGERLGRWSKGRATGFDPVVHVERVGVVPTYDVEMENQEHNFLANGIVSHNSHAVVYSMIAFWCMYLKRRWPLEFYLALLSTEPDLEEMRRIMRNARKRGVEILPADVRTSKAGFSIDPDKHAIRGSLIDIKFVGEAAAQEIAAGQPFLGLQDFLDRINKKKVNKRSFEALLAGGALDELVPNVKRFWDDREPRWELAKKGKWAVLAAKLAEDVTLPGYTTEERVLMAMEYNPLAFGAHPLDVYAGFVERNVKVPVEDLGAFGFYDRKRLAFVLAWVLEVKSGPVGHADTGLDKRDEILGYGRQSARLYVEDASGEQHRVRVDWSAWEAVQEHADGLAAVPIIACVDVMADRKIARANYLVNLSVLKRKLEEGKPLGIWERLVVGKHPTLEHDWKSKAVRRGAMLDLAREVRRHPVDSYFNLTGVVIAVSRAMDKRLQEMAFITLQGYQGLAELVCFGTNWPEFKPHVKLGKLMTLRVLRMRKGLQLDQEGRVWKHD